jgi:hypothetical protein
MIMQLRKMSTYCRYNVNSNAVLYEANKPPGDSKRALFTVDVTSLTKIYHTSAHALMIKWH